ncbi:hypothetical protein BCU94_02855 [Shewanella sp. 10N.286.52.C2]|uniref:hypothetical protein n=1 Tax=Shewanella sp. 10N.286.52.C2 TaxID=1880838 RepID=UPI000C85F4DE|nr:hypothetical protein [Shewanella sp. 10N.286.52.C2]PMG29709.1 hypothetical protein BCU94_02855 [Shewanella sp. 10N.286.52.C2]
MKINITLGLFFIVLTTFSVNSYSARDVDRTNNQAIAADQLLNQLAQCYVSDRDYKNINTDAIKGVLDFYEDQDKVRLAVNSYRGRNRGQYWAENYTQIANRCVEVSQQAVSIHQFLAKKIHSQTH